MEILEAFFICDDGAPSPDTVGFGAPLSLDCALGVPGGHALPAVGLLLTAPIMKRGKKKIEEKITA